MIDFKGKDSEALSNAITAAGHFVCMHDNVLEVSDESAVQAIIDGFTLDQACAPVIGRIKQIAHEKILAFLPDWKQSNFNARMNELNDARFSRPLTADENADIAQMRLAWAAAKAIRDASNVHGEILAALTGFAAIRDYDCTTGWPE